ncbi:hypothetical protein [Aliikangiella sp. IMCC44632]
MTNRQSNAIFTLFAIGVGLILAPYYFGSIEYKPLEEYAQNSFELVYVGVQEFDTTSRSRYGASRTTQYYELELYSSDKKRYFLRSPHEEEMLELSYKLRTNDYISLYHLDEIEKNGGQRIVGLWSNGDVVFSFEDAVYEQESKYWFMRLLSIIFIVVASLLLWLFKERGKMIACNS